MASTALFLGGDNQVWFPVRHADKLWTALISMLGTPGMSVRLDVRSKSAGREDYDLLRNGYKCRGGQLCMASNAYRRSAATHSAVID